MNKINNFLDKLNIRQKISGNNNKQSGRDMYNITNNYDSNQVGFVLNHIPSLDKDYIERNKKKNEILKAIEENNIIQVYGISGIGKTQLIKSIAKDMNCKNTYWISCDDNGIEINLNNITTTFNEGLDILKAIKSKNALVVIDNFNGALKNICSEFEEYNKNDSKLIFTSKIKSDLSIKRIDVDYMTLSEAYSLIKMNTNEDLLNDKLMKFLEKIDRHPMTLQILKNYLLDSENGISICDFENKINDLVNLQDSEISSSQKVCEKIIGIYYNNSKSLYKFLSLFQGNLIESEFLKSIILGDINSLIHKNFLKLEDTHYYIHSIILDSIKSVVNNDEENNKLSDFYKHKIIEYLKLKLITRNFIKNLFDILDNNYSKVIIYNTYIVMNNYHDKSKVVSDIKYILKDCKLEKYFEIKLLIEQYEMEISIEAKEKREILIHQKIIDLERIENTVQCKETIKLIKHHIGKYYNWLNDYKKSVEVFNSILKIDPFSYSSVLQLCRAYRNLAINDKENKLEYIDNVYRILKNIDFRKLPVSIFLEIISLIIYQPFNQKKVMELCLWNNFDIFEEYSNLYLDNKIFEHIYIIMGNIASNLYHNKSEFYKKWFEKIEHPNINDCDNKLLRSMVFIYCYEVRRRIKKKEDYDELFEEINLFWEMYKDKNNKLKIKFDYKAIIECLIDSNKIKEVEKELDEIYDDKNMWHLRYRSQIEYGKGNYENALLYINKTLDKCDEKTFKPYVETFNNDKDKILLKLNHNLVSYS